jgi:hypothetical protein
MLTCILACSHNNLRNEPTNLVQTLEITNIRSKKLVLYKSHITKKFVKLYNLYLKN